jgi:hypothetical protein
MNETKYRKQALLAWAASREEVQQELTSEVNTLKSRLASLMTHLRALLSHHKRIQ